VRASSVSVSALIAFLFVLVVFYFFYLTQAYYFSTDSSYIVLRAGSPHFTLLPGFGAIVIQTDFKVEDLANRIVRADIGQGKVQGFWFLHAKEGYELWGKQLADCLEPVNQAKWLSLLGQTKSSIENLPKGIVNSATPTVGSEPVSNLEKLAKTNPESFTSETLQALITRLTNKNIYIRSDAASILRQLAETNPKAFTPGIVRSLTSLLIDKNYVMHSDAVLSVLGPLMQSEPEVRRSVTALLSEKDGDVRSRVVFAIEQLARNDPATLTPEFVQPLIALLTDSDNHVRSNSASALGQLAATRPEFFTPEIIQSLTTLLADREYPVRANAISALGQLSRTRPELFKSVMVQSLTALLMDRAPLVRSSTALALGQFAQTRPEFFAPATAHSLIPLLTDQGSFVPCSSAFALSQLARTRPELFTPDIVQSLAARLTDEDLSVRSSVASALAELAQGNPASFTPEIIQSLFTLLADENPVVRSSAAPALGSLTQKRPEVLQTLFLLLKNGKDSNGRNGASEGLFMASLKGADQKELIVHELEKLAKSPQPYLRAAASQALEMIAIGDFVKEARAHPDQIEYIRSRLNDIKSLDESLREKHLQFAAQIVLDEIDKIKSENK
jgi:HEAT repeat protein